MTALGIACNHPRCSAIETRLHQGEALATLTSAYGLERIIPWKSTGSGS